MLWIGLAALGVPIWLVIGALGGAVISRRTFRNQSGVFACKVRTEPGTSDWPRAKTYGRWVHDVLIVHRGLALVRHTAFGAVGVTGPVVGVSAKGLGDDPVALSIHLDDGSTIEVAAPDAEQNLLAGPFMP